jgi:hypothetical protein
MNYFYILRQLQRGDKGSFDIPVEKQRLFLESLGEAKDDIDRGYKQYRCQNFFVPTIKVSLFNIVAAILLPFLGIYFLLKGMFVKKGEHIEVMMEQKGMDEVVPDIVREKFKPDSSHWNQGTSMVLSDVGFICKLLARAPHHPYFVLKALMNVVHYSDMISRHSPKVMIQFGEFSFSSSLLTAYCHRHHVTHIDIMHGEKLYFIRDAFFHYDECYVWDEYYADLFRSLKAEPSQFRVALPRSMKLELTINHNPNIYADYKYYLALYNEKQIKSIVESMAFAKLEGKSVKYRPHPRYSDMVLLKKYVSQEEIEMPSEVSIMESISNLSFAVGSYTTVLSQAFFSGKKVILDDITFQSQYEKLKEMKYILSSTCSTTLSNFQIV